MKRGRRTPRPRLWLLLVGLAPASSLGAQDLPKEVRWARDAAEHDALFLQVYREAAGQVGRAAVGLTPGSWAVILDADETVLDNSDLYRARAIGGRVQPPYDAEAFRAWAREARAPALPGAAAFIAHVKTLGGRVVVVTNREEAVCDATRENLRRLALAVDAVICKRPTDPDDKTPRYEAVANGTTDAGLPPLGVVAWIGDNIQDFPRLTQDVRTKGEAGLADFGIRFFLLPNPMYGSWETNPPR